MPKKYQAVGSVGNKRPTRGWVWEWYRCPTSSGYHIRKVLERREVALSAGEVERISRALTYFEGTADSASLRERLEGLYPPDV